LSRTEFHHRATEFLKKIQDTVSPKHLGDVVAINMETGEYVLAADSDEAFEAYRARWPNVLGYICRVNGEASTKFHGM
jgi:hypothetical protein